MEHGKGDRHAKIRYKQTPLARLFIYEQFNNMNMIMSPISYLQIMDSRVAIFYKVPEQPPQPGSQNRNYMSTNSTSSSSNSGAGGGGSYNKAPPSNMSFRQQ